MIYSASTVTVVLSQILYEIKVKIIYFMKHTKVFGHALIWNYDTNYLFPISMQFKTITTSWGSILVHAIFILHFSEGPFLILITLLVSNMFNWKPTLNRSGGLELLYKELV